MNKKSISCIIPCHNCQDYIYKTVDSLINQTIKPLEIILVNDASTDNTLDVLKQMEVKHPNVIKVIDLETNKGPSYARNFGVENSKGEYILFLDSDDIAEPFLIEKYLFKLNELNKKEDDYILCFSGYIQVNEKDEEISDVVRGIQVEPEEILGYQLTRNYISTSGVLIKKDYFLKTGGFNEEIRYSEDWDLWLRLAQYGGFAYVDEPLVKIRRHGSNLSSKIGKMLGAERAVLKQYSIDFIKNAIFKRKLSFQKNVVDFVSVLFRLDYWEEGFTELKSLLSEGYDFYNLYFYIGLYYLKHKNIAKALDYFIKTINIKENHGAALNNIGAIYLYYGKNQLAEKYLKLAIEYFPAYMDASHNLGLLNRTSLSLEDLKFTWRELREVLTKYTG
ncbi:glycosyltransferase [Tepidimicrobium xylanilyticum]|uniref:Tetratricopeptide repeat-containing protein n=1 Tax=Tepidimicrobium xylanilyticum TaxID=1123352 RepID=A0A1H2QQ82_9FIRM|nr:glycosyltransferase [Tepidimicrobium xylanilyticum]SDW09347.1 Tetratricopeptide repeat-containing protein [Tepidimicrobium xylanilyticum]